MLFSLLVFLGDPLHYERPERPVDIDLWLFFKELAVFVGFIIFLGFFVSNALLSLSLLALAFAAWLAWVFFVKG